MSWCAGYNGKPLNAASELSYQSGPSPGELTPSSQEMLPRLSWQPGDREKHHASPSSRQTTDEALCRLRELLALSLHRSSPSLLLVLGVYHEITSLFVPNFLLLLHYDGQAHAWMDSTVEMKGASCGEGANSALTRAADLQILDLRCARLDLQFGCPIFPRSVRNDVGVLSIVDQGDALTLFNGDRRLDKIRRVHMYLVRGPTGRCDGRATGNQDQCHHNTAKA